MTDYIRIGPFNVTDGNATQNLQVEGGPAPTGFCGYGHALQRRLTASGMPALVTGVACIVHSFSRPPGHPKLPPSGADLAKGKEGASIDDTASFDAHLTLVLEVDLTALDDELLDEFQERHQAVLGPHLVGARLCGGRITGLRRDGFAAVLAGEDCLFRDLRRLPRGMVLRDRSDIITDRLAAGARDALDVVLDAVTLEPDPDGGWRRLIPGWTVPVAIGFRALENPKSRKSPRDPAGTALHAFVEGVTGLADYIGTRRICAEKDISRMFWKYGYDAENGLYLLKAE